MALSASKRSASPASAFAGLGLHQRQAGQRTGAFVAPQRISSGGELGGGLEQLGRSDVAGTAGQRAQLICLPNR
jgi:hypothetical protein